MLSLKFLDLVWKGQKGWVDLPIKHRGGPRDGEWEPFIVKWPDQRRTVEQRIWDANEEGLDLYFSVLTFRPPRGQRAGRKIEDVQPSRWLFADLDSVTPADCRRSGMDPTIVWRSSRGRYQALWRLDSKLEPERLAHLNRALTQTLGADPGGWDLTQVLRIPGTFNHKYDDPQEVKLVRATKRVYAASDLAPQLGVGAELVLRVAAPGSTPRPNGAPRKLRLPARARALLATQSEEVVPGERSARLWELECLLAEAGLDETAIFDLVWPSAWNKWKDLNSGPEQLKRDIRRATKKVMGGRASSVASRTERPEPPTPSNVSDDSRGDTDSGVEGLGLSTDRLSLPFEGYGDFLSRDIVAPRWLVEGIWSASSHGIIGGEPKTSKSTLSLALGLSVASKSPFLGAYTVRSTGPVLMIQEENAPWVVQDRLRKLANLHGMLPKEKVHVRQAGRASVASKIVELDFPGEYPFYILNNYGFDLTQAAHRDALEEAVVQLTPRMIILDPLYLIMGSANPNNVHELKPLLQWLLYLRFEYDMAVVVVHHMRKLSSWEGDAGVRAGQRLSGHHVLHGWIESAIYTELRETRTPSENLRIRLEREFRNSEPRKPLDIGLRIGAPGSLVLDVNIDEFDLGGELVAMVEMMDVDGKGVEAGALAESLGVDKRTVLKRARGEGLQVKGGARGRGHTWRIFPK